MPVSTRFTDYGSFSHAAPHGPVGMAAESGHDEGEHDENEPQNTQDSAQHTPQRMTKDQMLHLQKIERDLDGQLASVREELNSAMRRASPSSGAGGGVPDNIQQILSGSSRTPRSTGSVARNLVFLSGDPRSAGGAGGTKPKPKSKTSYARHGTTGSAPTSAGGISTAALSFGGESLAETIGESVRVAFAASKSGSFIGKDEAKLISSSLAKDERSGFKSKVLQQSARVEPRVKELMQIKWTSRAELAKILKERGLGAVDERLSSTILACLKPKETAPVVELLSLATEDDIELAMSGLLMLKWIDEEGKLGAYNKDEQEKAIFDTKPFFIAGADERHNVIAGVKLVKAIEVLPPKYHTHGLDKLKLIISKIPPPEQNEMWAKQMRIDLHKAERGRAKVPWSPAELCTDIAGFLEMADPAGPIVTAATDKDKGKAPNTSKIGHKDDGGERARRYKGKTLKGKVTSRWHDGKFTFLTIDGDGDQNVFAHKSAIVGEKPNEGDAVEFEIEYATVDGKRRERAKNVKKVIAPSVSAAQIQTEDEDDEECDVESDDDGVPPTHYRAVVR